tara:strand:+ start:168 stop:380 length:213 start_codon:yes stop_codon:yes gene_type:complete
MSVVRIYTGSKSGLARAFIVTIFAITLSGCVAGAAVSLATGTLTAAADVTSSVVGGVADVVVPDSDQNTE